MTKNLQYVPRYKVLEKSLLEEVSSSEPGTRLGSIKGIMSRFGVSQATVDRALSSLKEDGLVECRIGKGIYVASKEAMEEREIESLDLFVFGTKEMVKNPGFHHDVVSEIGKIYGDDGKWIRVSFIQRSSERDEVIKSIERLSPKGAVVMYLSEPEVISYFNRGNIPYVLLMPYWPVDLPNSFRLDNEGIVKCWIEHLADFGHKKIAFLHGVLPREYNRDMNERLQFFYENMARRGLAVDPDIVLYGGFTREEGYHGARQLIESGKDFTSVIINDHAVGGVYQAFQEANIEIGKDVSIIGTDDLSWASQMHPPLTTVRISRTNLAKMAVDRLEAMVKGKVNQFDCETIPFKLIERESTAKI